MFGIRLYNVAGGEHFVDFGCFQAGCRKGGPAVLTDTGGVLTDREAAAIQFYG